MAPFGHSNQPDAHVMREVPGADPQFNGLLSALDAMADGLALFDAQDRLILHNRKFVEQFPFLEQLGDLHGFTFYALASVPSGEGSRVAEPDSYIAERMRHHSAADGTPFEIKLDNGGTVQVRECRTPDGGTIALWSDVSKIKKAEAKILRAIDGIPDGFLLLDPDDRIFLSNTSLRLIFGSVGVDLGTGARLSDVLRDAQARGLFAEDVEPIQRMLDEPRLPPEMRAEIALRDGGWMLVSHRRMANGCAVGIWTDITAQKRRESELIAVREQLREQTEALAEFARLVALQARSDILTGLPNRFALEERLETMLSDREPRTLWVGIIDIDHFKGVNDAVGHGSADDLLRAVATFLRGQLRGDDLLARLGGDEFAMLLTDIDEHDALRIARRLNTAVHGHPFQVGGRTFTLGLSIGLVRANGIQTSVSSLLAAADTACHVAKESGRDRVQLYDLGDPKVNSTRQRMSWAERIQLGLELDRFHMHLQAIVDDRQTVLGYEALIRLIDETGSWCQPGQFLPAAQRLGLMGRIDAWVCRHAIDYAMRLIERRANQYVSMNIGAHSLADVGFQRDLMDMLDLNPGVETALRVEVTETEGVEDLGAIAAFLNALRARGVHVYLDDFGNGYNSFESLKRLPVDGIKIDWTVTRDLLRDPIDKALMKAAISIANSLGLELVAEGVEDEVQLAKLRELGATMYQGFLFHRPADAETVLA